MSFELHYVVARKKSEKELKKFPDAKISLILVWIKLYLVNYCSSPAFSGFQQVFLDWVISMHVHLSLVPGHCYVERYTISCGTFC